MLMLLFFLIAVGISFLCSILEAVLLSITASYIELTKESNMKLGLLMESQKKNIDFSIAAILTLNTFAHTLGAAGVGAEAALMFGEEYMFYISAVLTILILVFSEIIPKTIGAFYWKNLANFSTRVIKFLIIITYPLLIILNRITIFIAPKRTKSITKEEIIATANIAEEEGLLREKESLIIENLFQLRETKVSDILTPRSVMFAIKEEELLKGLRGEIHLDMEKFKEYSRVPVYGDNIDDIKGLVISKELFYEMIENKFEDKSKIIKNVSVVNENIPISKLLDMFLAKKEHLFVVSDNYGQTEGVVTLEDAVETLLGMEIVDELDSNVDMREVAKAKTLEHRMRKLGV
ncbi:CNNM domain-containing protein [Halarcobacter ebronensis]|uniref:Transporter n=1 Tax=Halarcobacter ebronensis TaxID=1462615 RepID=A0A4Q1ANS6_9BACT|nr:CNNM domain-containing protein [Halarcobacter ebronensis]QKF83459.1 HlyC/CorC family transporter [Halarcobacter ebronensis]RXK08258.1 transporter [Halarcobacter ebronensis]